jgi:hypothetical protein
LLRRPDRLGLILRITEHYMGEPDFPYDRMQFLLQSLGFDTAVHGGIENQIDTGSDEQVLELAETLGLPLPDTQPPAATAMTISTAQPLVVFASHLAAHRQFVGQVGQELAYFGINLFVAHDSIPDDAAWQSEIERALDAAHAGLAFLHPGFKESGWCAQEVGWLLGRHVPVMPLNFGVTPYGPLGKVQAGPERTPTVPVIVGKVIERMRNQDALRPNLAASLVQAMQTSGSFNRTDRIWAILRELECDADQSAKLLAAAKTNDQIYRANSALDGMAYPYAIVEYLRRQPEAGVVAADIDAYEQFLDLQAADERRDREAAENMPF